MNSQNIAEYNHNTPLPDNFTMTLEEFIENDIEGYEYINGELVPMAAAVILHGKISVRVIRYLDSFVHKNQLGEVYTAETSFLVGERVMKPDVAYVAASRVPEDETKGFPIPPDLAVEVISPSDILWNVYEKALAYLDAGTRIVWVIEPVARTVTVFRSITDIKTLTQNDILTGEDVVEGFSCPVARFFE